MQKKTKKTSKDKIKIIFMIPTLTPGGAERVFAFVSQNLDPDAFFSKLLVIGTNEQITYNVDKIPVTYLDKNRVLYAIPKLLQFLLKQKPDIVFSSIGHLNMISGLLTRIFTSTRFIIRPTNIKADKSVGWLEKKCFSWVDTVVCQSQDMAENFSKLYGTPAEKITVIENPITNIQEINVDDAITKTKRFITVGRLNKVKGHARVLSILSKLEKDFHYTIIGDGPEKENLFQLIQDLQLETKITYIPHTNKVNDYLIQNDLFLQGSYSEGFPNAVLESCTMGTPVLAFDVPGGTKEIIEHGSNGFLVQNEEEYLSFLSMGKNWERSVVRNSVITKFSPKIILDKYENLLSASFL